MEPENSNKIDFPELIEGEMDQAMLSQLVADITGCTELLEVIPKYSAQGYAPEQSDLDLTDAVDQLVKGELRGLQIRYNYQGNQWWDTLMRTPKGVKLVRVKHDF